MQPTDYVVYYPDPGLEAAELARLGDPLLIDPARVETSRDFTRRADAVRFATKHNGAVRLRYGFRDTTPPELPPGTDWDWEEVTIWDHGYDIENEAR